MAKKLIHDSINSAAGNIYQQYEIVNRCFELTSDQVIYIEKFGDIAISNSENIEVKCFSDNLTDSHQNLWKTLRNWLQEGFTEELYKNLTLLTTQSYGPSSKIQNWNQNNLEAKLSILKEIHSKAKERERNRRQKQGNLSIPESLVLMEEVMNSSKERKLKKILDKFIILDSSPMLKEQYELLIERHTKPIPLKNKKAFINAIFGWIVSPSNLNEEGWTITYKAFSNEIENLTTAHCSGSKVFPRKHFDAELTEPYSEESLYVKKIKDIEYAEVIQEAHHDYIATKSTISDDFSEGISFVHISRYEKDILSDFETMARNAVRNCNDNDILKASKNFYDSWKSSLSPTLSGHETPPKSFKNGIVHLNMDDNKKDYKWRLK